MRYNQLLFWLQERGKEFHGKAFAQRNLDLHRVLDGRGRSG
jgi:hypothetical protein